LLWKRRSAIDFDTAAPLAEEIRASPLIASLLCQRGITQPEQARRFLSPSIDHLHSPYEMLGMNRAVERLSAAIARREKVLIYGDYDVDGTTAIVILKTAIELCGGSADFHVPHRLREGYGMRDDVLERAAANGVTLVISVDTGIRAFAAAETLRGLGIDLIVTDHHLPNEVEGVPHAVAVLNPNQSGCGYPCKELCGAGVAFKLAQALLEKNGRDRLLPSFLKVVAIATIADAVPLTGENRVFAKLGLEGLRSPVNPGLKALLDAASLTNSRAITASDVAFRVAPRLNAAGRMDVARDVIDLFTMRDPTLARDLAERLTRLNQERQQEEARIAVAIHEQIASDPALRDAWFIVVDGEGWHRGVIGIAATRVTERYCRPALVISREGDNAQGSGRSTANFHLLEALESCSELFTRYGGHAHAAGFALQSRNIPELRSRLDSYARARLSQLDLERVLHFDAELSLSEITAELFAELQSLEPFGMGNPEPVFIGRDVRLMFPPRILKEKHAKLRVRQADSQDGTPPLDALAWRMAPSVAGLHPGDLLEIAYSIERSHNRDSNPNLQLCVCDLRVAGNAAAAGK
jgi:single-stranded-DNA-specific exonuclease